MSSRTGSEEFSARSYWVAYVALVALSLATFGLSYLPLRAWEVPVALGIALVKATIVALVFMGLARQAPSHWMTLVTAVLLLVFFIGLAVSDALMRNGG